MEKLMVESERWERRVGRDTGMLHMEGEGEGERLGEIGEE